MLNYLAKLRNATLRNGIEVWLVRERYVSCTGTDERIPLRGISRRYRFDILLQACCDGTVFGVGTGLTFWLCSFDFCSTVGSLFGGMDGCAFDDLMGMSTQTLLKPVPELDLEELFANIPETFLAGSSKYAMPEVEQNRFAKPISDEQVKAVQESVIPGNIKKSTNWALNVWNEWSASRKSMASATGIPLCGIDFPPNVLIAKAPELNHWMSKFVLEVRRKDGKSYPPNTLYQLCCGVMHYIRGTNETVDYFNDSAFAGFRKTLDGEMKKLRSQGLGTDIRQAEPISAEEEELLWQCGALGGQNPQSLVDSMLYMCGLYFALRSGQEDKNLQLSQIKLFEPVGGRAYLQYTENVSKNNAGGLKERKIKAKQVIHHANLQRPDRCFVKL